MEAMVDIDLQGLTMDTDPDQLTADTEEKREKLNLKVNTITQLAIFPSL